MPAVPGVAAGAEAEVLPDAVEPQEQPEQPGAASLLESEWRLAGISSLPQHQLSGLPPVVGAEVPGGAVGPPEVERDRVSE